VFLLVRVGWCCFRSDAAGAAGSVWLVLLRFRFLFLLFLLMFVFLSSAGVFSCCFSGAGVGFYGLEQPSACLVLILVLGLLALLVLFVCLNNIFLPS
jgi:hypothetical protein